MKSLNEVTLAELHDLVSKEIAAGYDSDKQEGRKRLLRAVEDCAAEAGEADAAAGLIDGQSWRIAEIRVSGIGGIAALDPPALEFTPVPGITVVRGLNGQGKTSLARSINCALRGDRDASTEVTNTLWAAELLTEGTAAGSVHLTLVGGASRLDVQVDFLRESEAPKVVGLLSDDVESRQVELGTAWRSALDNARASYSYDALQSRLVETKALQSFLEELLVLGPEWQRVRDAVETRAERATAAQKAFDAATKKALAAEKQIADRYKHADNHPARPDPVAWPHAKDSVDVDAWLHDAGLAITEPQTRTKVAADHERRIASIRTRLHSAEKRLSAAEATIDGPGMAAALHHLEQVTEVEALDSAACPLCGSTADWREHVRDLTGGLRERTTCAQEVTAAVIELRDWAATELAPLFDADIPGGPDQKAADFRAATARGCHAHSVAHSAASDLLDQLDSDVHRQWLDELRAASDTAAGWRSELATVVHEFATSVRGKTEDAVDAGIWKKAQETLNELQVSIRQDRQDAVTARLNEALTRMLPDADIRLPAIQHQGGVKQQRGVKVELTMGGHEATLGMLSSGQRNALLLTPLMVHDVPGPFGFLIVDDPVHALDDTRVDLLARELARLAETRQVIALTHDPRLEEHLRARHPDMTVIELQRDAATRTVTWTSHTQLWKSLLDDARTIQAGADNDGWGYAEDLASVVAGLCRAAVDGAIRQAVITRAVQRHDDVDAALAVLAKAVKTSQRIEHVTALAGGKTHLPRLETGRRKYLTFWNKGAHGQMPENANLKETVDAAEAACQELAEHDWTGV
ncbi:hypothetical protein [Pseudonocardia sp.]|uniref:hypothetical protein n=1 Tax=Pseudonocardia sp. TaxID=60912 RepID=UPI0025F21345|nr:hypothetical protein [Pseudonocardia sp.]